MPPGDDVHARTPLLAAGMQMASPPLGAVCGGLGAPTSSSCSSETATAMCCDSLKPTAGAMACAKDEACVDSACCSGGAPDIGAAPDTGADPASALTQQRFLHAQVPFIHQLFSWDCGLACVMMVLRGLGIHGTDHACLRRMCPTTSIWTIDLAHLLAAHGLVVSFSTVTVGINASYGNETFYMEHIEADERRVRRLFATAPQAGVRVRQCSVGSQPLALAVGSGAYLGIVLVDKRKLDPWQAAADLCWNYTTGVTSATSYTGHYVVLVGWEPATREFWVLDPARSGGPERVGVALLDAARRSFGTDEDLLLVRVPGAVEPSGLHEALDEAVQKLAAQLEAAKRQEAAAAAAAAAAEEAAAAAARQQAAAPAALAQAEAAAAPASAVSAPVQGVAAADGAADMDVDEACTFPAFGGGAAIGASASTAGLAVCSAGEGHDARGADSMDSRGDSTSAALDAAGALSTAMDVADGAAASLGDTAESAAEAAGGAAPEADSTPQRRQQPYRQCRQNSIWSFAWQTMQPQAPELPVVPPHQPAAEELGGATAGAGAGADPSVRHSPLADAAAVVTMVGAGSADTTACGLITNTREGAGGDPPLEPVPGDGAAGALQPPQPPPPAPALHPMFVSFWFPSMLKAA